MCLYSCGQNSEANSQDAPKITDEYFVNFPTAQFYELTLGDDVASSIDHLSDHDFIEKKEFPGHYINTEKQVELVITEQDKLNRFKVFLKNKEDVDNHKFYCEKFGSQALSKSESKMFSSYEIQTEKMSYSITIFKQNTSLRIAFELHDKH